MLFTSVAYFGMKLKAIVLMVRFSTITKSNRAYVMVQYRQEIKFSTPQECFRKKPVLLLLSVNYEVLLSG